MPNYNLLRDTKLDHIYDPVLDFHTEYLKRTKRHHTYQTLSAVIRLKEYATISLGFGRQIGNSWYIARTARDNDIIYCRDNSSVRYMQERVNAIARVAVECQVYSWKNPPVVEGAFENIWIDEARGIPESDLERLYTQFADRCERFILIR